MRRCYSCGAEVSMRERVPFKELCPKCDAFLHCCKNCRLYASLAHNHCLSTTTEFVAEVERSNYCDEFEFREVEDPKRAKDAKGSRSSKNPAADPRPDPAEDARAMSARERFNRLFKN